MITWTSTTNMAKRDHMTFDNRAKKGHFILSDNNSYFLSDHGAIRTHKSLVPKTNALTIRPRGHININPNWFI